METLASRSTQDLLAERRANINEGRHGCKVTMENCLAHVALIDSELESRDVEVRRINEEAFGRVWAADRAATHG